MPGNAVFMRLSGFFISLILLHRCCTCCTFWVRCCYVRCFRSCCIAIFVPVCFRSWKINDFPVWSAGRRRKAAEGVYDPLIVFFLLVDEHDVAPGGIDIAVPEKQPHKLNVVGIAVQCSRNSPPYSDTATANRLMELGVPAPYGGEKWSPTVVRHMLSNEKMKGDALIQKSYVADFLDKRQRKNKGEVQQYYVTGGHEAIIDPVLFDHVQEIVKASIEDERGFSGVNPWSTKLICGKCGNYFRIKHRHYKVCWECRDGYKKPDPCKNSYIYETARDWHVKEIMRTALVERPYVVKTVNGIIDRVVKDEKRKERVKTAVTEFGRMPAEQLVTDDEDFLLVIKAIRFFPDYHIEAELVDGSRMEMELKPCWPEERKRRHQ